MKQSFTLFLFALLVLHIQVQHCIAQDETPYWQRAAVLLNSQQYREAFAETNLLLNKHPNDVVVLRIQGVCLMELGRLDEAVATLQRGLEIEPESVACRYYLAQALAYRGSLLEAVKHLEVILAMAPQSEYGKQAGQVLPEIQSMILAGQAVRDANRYNVYLKIGEEYDDNVAARAETSKDTSENESWRTTYTFYGEIRYPDQEIDNSSFSLGLGYALDGSYHHSSPLDQYDLFANTVNLFIRTTGTLYESPYRLQIQTKYTDTNLSNDAFSNVIGLFGIVDYQWHQQVSTAITGAWSDKNYAEDTIYPEYFSRDGDEYRIGLKNNVTVCKNHLILGLDYSYRFNDSDGSQYVLKSHDLTGSVKAALPWLLQFHGQVAYQEHDYPEYVQDPPGRLDDIWTYYISLQRYLWNDQMTVDISFTHTTSSSTQEFAEYDRSVFGIGITMNY